MATIFTQMKCDDVSTCLLSHLHWDHIQGLPFFTPLLQEGAENETVLDSFARADFYLSVPSLEDVGVEEGFVTFLSLPADLLVRLGKVRVPLGRANVDHRPETFTVDRPDIVHFET